MEIGLGDFSRGLCRVGAEINSRVAIAGINESPSSSESDCGCAASCREGDYIVILVNWGRA